MTLIVTGLLISNEPPNVFQTESHNEPQIHEANTSHRQKQDHAGDSSQINDIVQITYEKLITIKCVETFSLFQDM